MLYDETRLRQLMLAGLNGDAAAHRTLLEALAQMLRGYYRRRMGASAAEAEDLVQETLIAVHTRRDSYDPAFPLTAWVHSIARYRLIDHWRRNKRRGVSVPLENASALFEESSADEIEAKLDAGVLLAKLPPKQRDAIRLVKLEEKSVREAAAITGWSESDVKISIHRGLKTLAKLMREQTS